MVTLKDLLQKAMQLGRAAEKAEKVYRNQHGSYKREEDMEVYMKVFDEYTEMRDEFFSQYKVSRKFWSRIKNMF